MRELGVATGRLVIVVLPSDCHRKATSCRCYASAFPFNRAGGSTTEPACSAPHASLKTYDVRREWFRIRLMEDHGVASLAILRAHGITVEALTAAEAGIDRPLTEEKTEAMTEEDKEARKAFLLVLKKKNDELLKALARVDNAGVNEKDDSWVVSHGYVGGR
ncbi:hypothetical protein [Streptomyces milbemycinicus]|nr:hypothetical protein [Streptomyces milbemycinicus]